jgi:hypothetical protein
MVATGEETKPAAPPSFPLLASMPPLPFACRGRSAASACTAEDRREGPPLTPAATPASAAAARWGSGSSSGYVMNARGRRKVLLTPGPAGRCGWLGCGIGPFL